MRSDSQSKILGVRAVLILIIPVLLASLAWGSAFAFRSSLSANKPAAAVSPTAGRTVYLNNCAYCHGEQGDGRGTTYLEPRARAFGIDRFKFISTLNGVPSDDDILRCVDCGIPGSAMPAFAALSETDRRSCIEEIRELTRVGLYQKQVIKALKNDEDPEPEKFSRVVAEMSIPGKPLAIPSIPASTPESVARGKATYAVVCASCHGPEGKGDGPQVRDMKNDDGSVNIPRDLTKGLYKAGGEPERLYARIRLGIPGTPMPATDKLSDSEVADLIHFVKSLATNGSAR